MSKQWILKNRPDGTPKDSDFELKDVELPSLKQGEIKIRNKYISVDPYMRPKMSANEDSYTEAYALNGVIDGMSIGEVVESESDKFEKGDLVMNFSGWVDEAIVSEDKAKKVDTRGLPDVYFMSILGMTGATAYFGLLHVAQAKSGDTVFVSAAAGAVGSTVVQIAKAMGMTVIGSAGGREKVEFVKSLGADDVIDYKDEQPVYEQLKAFAPDGIDVYFDNVGGDHLDAALGNAKVNARFAICGMISGYNKSDNVEFENFWQVIAKRIQIRGFLYNDFQSSLPEFESQLAVWLQKGLVKEKHSEVQGIENVVEAFKGLFEGNNIGKMIVKV
ncbi:NADP-dependent oxidoreductase [Sphingobacterium deserti]|uniref:Alcohol dehydrogenase, zinc-containing n=1 Tax=Sphingobacterium deserti TaxID=1229276 RepID=A0A0B8SZL1_9SPHI|nr:NADP-dependent oxidoreductase [Sphingobacterium deserti]KGE13016.1 alcohol dehydrogenase, zinc-containing [Sphingobacterium deserti]